MRADAGPVAIAKQFKFPLLQLSRNPIKNQQEVGVVVGQVAVSSLQILEVKTSPIISQCVGNVNVVT